MVPSKLLSVALSAGLFGTQASAGVFNYDGDRGYSAYARSKTASAPVVKQASDAHDLLPIREEYLFPHLQKRSDDLSSLHLEETATLYFGKPATGYDIHLATINAKPDPQHPLISLEKFDGFTKRISCRGEDIVLEFQDKDAMTYATKQWDWVNHKDQDHFFLVSQHHHNGCNPEDERKPHKVVSVKSDAQKSTIVLTTEDASWDEALGDFTFNFETIQHPIIKLTKRRDPIEVGYYPSPISIIIADFICSKANQHGIKMSGCKPNGDFGFGDFELLTGAAKAALEGAWKLIPNFDAMASATIEWGNDDINDKVVFVESSGTIPDLDGVVSNYEVKGTCIGCYVRGTFEYTATGGRDSKTGKTELIVGFRPKIQARLLLELTGTATVSKELNYVADFISKGLKAYVVKNIVCLEPQFLSGPGVIMKAGASGNFTVGFELDTGAPLLMLKATNGDKVQVLQKDWGTLKVDPIIRASQVKSHSEVNPYFRLGIGVGATFFKNSTISGKLGVWAGLNPQMISTMDLGYDSTGLCEGKPQIGAKFESSFRFDYSYTTVAKIESESKLANFLFDLVKPQSWADTSAALNQDKKHILFEKKFGFCKALTI
ncbi:hypothetical protein TWF106_000860 [Orbilia oligospora]|uniref:DUF7029 domain-containing protein n=1 Tax=Orbilia oligospora TaxID=2813651 RepID=A0A6G1LVJ9_ORBOL|nr:hypothetical protein TWF788_009755 [Orbilia oligospora]KAF3201899.1 hypothetical protein TWF679_011186 [Orbilia oligospora]KAF3226367.1 hypothetical protein TWF106_000860 [Orbilia oligospora]KAF3228925.1 hypothetical protein TWF191_002038 [Orbilia oligospora]KAF3235936.1 hypothetical protein TWF192_000591 [Orbilia oligospora]